MKEHERLCLPPCMQFVHIESLGYWRRGREFQTHIIAQLQHSDTVKRSVSLAVGILEHSHDASCYLVCDLQFRHTRLLPVQYRISCPARYFRRATRTRLGVNDGAAKDIVVEQQQLPMRRLRHQQHSKLVGSSGRHSTRLIAYLSWCGFERNTLSVEREAHIPYRHLVLLGIRESKNLELLVRVHSMQEHRPRLDGASVTSDGLKHAEVTAFRLPGLSGEMRFEGVARQHFEASNACSSSPWQCSLPFSLSFPPSSD